MKHNLVFLRTQKKWTQEQAADAMGVSRSHYVKLERGERGLTGNTISLAAKAFGVPASFVINEDGAQPPIHLDLNDSSNDGLWSDLERRKRLASELLATINRVSMPSEAHRSMIAFRDRLVPIPVAGRAEAGTFREVDDISDSDFEPEFIFDEPDPDFPNARMFAVAIQGDSMNAAQPPLLDGYRMICVSFDDAMVPLSDGMTVLVQRSRDGGLTREWSVKEVEMGDETISFCPRSTNPKHKPIVIPLNPDPTDGVTVEVIGIGRRISASIPRFRRR